MKRNVKKIFLFLIFMIPMVVRATDFMACGSGRKIPLQLVNIFSIVINIIKIVVPIILVVVGMISFFKVSISSKVDDEMNKAKQKLINNIIAAVVIFMIFPIVNTVISFVDSKNTELKSCVRCFINSKGCDIVNEEWKMCPGLLSDQDKYDENCNYIAGDDDNSGSSGSSGGGSILTVPTGDKAGLDVYPNPDSTAKWLKNYYLYIPENVDGTRSLIVHMHGAGEIGSGRDKLEALRKNDGYMRTIDNNGAIYNTYILIPHLVKDGWGSAWSDLKKLTDYIINTYDIDKTKITISGLSAGANGVSIMVNSFPKNYFERAVIVTLDKRYTAMTPSDNFADVETWVFYGKSDSANNISGCEPFHKNLLDRGFNSHIQAYDNIGHGTIMGHVLDDQKYWDVFRRKK